MTQAAAAHIPNIVNGVDMDALGASVAAIQADPLNGQVTFRATTAWQGRLRSTTEITSYDAGGQTIVRRHRISSDEPLELLGDNTAPNPQDMLLAALASCMMVGFVAGACSEGIELESLEIDTELALDLRGVFALDPSIPPGARAIKYTVRVRGNGTKEQFQQIHQNVTMTSPNYYHLANAIPLPSELVVG